MKQIYEEIYKKALPYYQQGREGDVDHLNWLYETIPQYVSEDELDYDILIPFAILHDAGYSQLPKDLEVFTAENKKLHAIEGAKIAQKVLSEVNYPEEQIKEIARLIERHDNWYFGESFADEPYLLAFNNLDFLWMATEKGFHIVRAMLKKEPKEFCEQIEKFQENNIKEGRAWFNLKIEALYEQLLRERKHEN